MRCASAARARRRAARAGRGLFGVVHGLDDLTAVSTYLRLATYGVSWRGNRTRLLPCKPCRIIDRTAGPPHLLVDARRRDTLSGARRSRAGAAGAGSASPSCVADRHRRRPSSRCSLPLHWLRGAPLARRHAASASSAARSAGCDRPVGPRLRLAPRCPHALAGALARRPPAAPQPAARIDITGSTLFHPVEMVVQALMQLFVTVIVLGLDPAGGRAGRLRRRVPRHVPALERAHAALARLLSSSAPRRTASTTASACTPTTTATCRLGPAVRHASATRRSFERRLRLRRRRPTAACWRCSRWRDVNAAGLRQRQPRRRAPGSRAEGRAVRQAAGTRADAIGLPCNNRRDAFRLPAPARPLRASGSRRSASAATCSAGPPTRRCRSACSMPGSTPA